MQPISPDRTQDCAGGGLTGSTPPHHRVPRRYLPRMHTKPPSVGVNAGRERCRRGTESRLVTFHAREMERKGDSPAEEGAVAGAEAERLAQDARREGNWKRWGPYLSERQWGTVREDYSGGRRLLGLLPSRSRPQPGLSLGRRRPARHHRPPGSAVLRPRALERARPDPQGAALRADRPGGEPRRGREGVLLLPRLHADPLVPARPSTSTRRPSSPTRQLVAENRERGKQDPELRAARHRRLRRRPVLRRLRRVRQGGHRRHPDPDHRRQPRARDRAPCTCCRRCGSGTPGAGDGKARATGRAA